MIGRGSKGPRKTLRVTRLVCSSMFGVRRFAAAILASDR
jgi:hypothetical protein